jgi:hypothetical protein
MQFVGYVDLYLNIISQFLNCGIMPFSTISLSFFVIGIIINVVKFELHPIIIFDQSDIKSIGTNFLISKKWNIFNKHKIDIYFHISDSCEKSASKDFYTAK